jgi:hypothetical protein
MRKLLAPQDLIFPPRGRLKRAIALAGLLLESNVDLVISPARQGS